MRNMQKSKKRDKVLVSLPFLGSSQTKTAKIGNSNTNTIFIETSKAHQKEIFRHFFGDWSRKAFSAPSRKAACVISEKSVVVYFQYAVVIASSTTAKFAFSGVA